MKKGLLFLMTLIAVGFLTACEDGDETTPNTIACFEYSPTAEIKVGTEISFTNCSENAMSYAWDFGDGNISTEENPNHTYETGGQFTVKMIAGNETSTDTISKSIVINGLSFYLEGTWSGNDEYGDITYSFSETSLDFSRQSPAMSGKGEVVKHNSDSKYLIIKIIEHSAASEQVGKYGKWKYTDDKENETDITIYDFLDSSQEAENSSSILVNTHTVTKN